MSAMMVRLLTAILLIGLVTAGPVKIQKRRGVSLPLTYGVSSAHAGSNIRHDKRSPPSIIAEWKKQLARIKLKYGEANTPPVKRATSGSLNLTDAGYDFGYFTSVQVGTPPQTFNIEVGIGSADFWVASNRCCVNATITNKYNPKLSSTWVNSTRKFLLDYVGGNVSGWVGTDTVSLGDFKVESQPMGAADFVTAGLGVEDPQSGLMGFGWSNLANIPGLPWWQHLASRGALQDPLFGVYIARHLLDAQGGNGAPGGSLDLGFANTAYYTGNITYTGLTGTSHAYWEVPVQSLTINDHLIDAGNTIAALDTGTSLITAPTNVVNGLFAQVPGAKPGTGDLKGFWTVPCDTNATLSFTINGVNYPVAAADWVFIVDVNVCIGTFQGYDLSSVKWVLGNVFLKNVYSVLRYDPPAVGFAELSPAVRFAGTGKTSTSSIPLSTSSPTTSTTSANSSSPTDSVSVTTVYVPPHTPSTTATSTTTSRGASSGGPEVSCKMMLLTFTSASLWIALSHLF